MHLVDLFQWTKMAENDYLAPASAESEAADFNDLIMLEILQLTETAELLAESSPGTRKALYSLIVQGIAIRDSIESLRN